MYSNYTCRLPNSLLFTGAEGGGGYGATMPDKLGGALVSPDEKYCITIKLITITLYF